MINIARGFIIFSIIDVIVFGFSLTLEHCIINLLGATILSLFMHIIDNIKKSKMKE